MLTIDAWSLAEVDDESLLALVHSLRETPAPRLSLDPVAEALAELRMGRPVVVIDDEDRENEGDLIFAASEATEQLVAFMNRWTSGLICVAMRGEDLDRLRLPPMTGINEDPKRTAYAVSVDSRHVQSTGISAADRSCTLRALASSATSHEDLSRPGHVLPLRAAEGGVLERRGHTEAAVDLARLAGLPPSGALAELVNDDGSMMRAFECRRFADAHGLKMISIADLEQYRWHKEQILERAAQTELPTEFGDFVAHGYRNVIDGTEHIALVAGDVDGGQDVLVSVQVECMVGHLFAARSCTCADDLHTALRTIADAGRGICIYVRDVELRAGGVVKNLQGHRDSGTAWPIRNSRKASTPCPSAFDSWIAAQILADLGVGSVRLLASDSDDEIARGDFGTPMAAIQAMSREYSSHPLRLPA